MTHEDANRRAWNDLARADSLFARVATNEECAQPLQTLDSRGWLPRDVRGLRVLCLAAGGGWQSILYATAGAEVTVVDLSEEMLRRDGDQANLRSLKVRTVRASMSRLEGLDDGEFDIVHQPVSTCYVADLRPVFREVARVLRWGGLYISQHKQPGSLQVDGFNRSGRYEISIPYYHEGQLPAVADTSYRETGTVEYLHRWEELAGEMCRAGLLIEDLVEPRRGDAKAAPGDFRHRGMFIPPYVRIKARKHRFGEGAGQQPVSVPDPGIWVPGSE